VCLCQQQSATGRGSHLQVHAYDLAAHAWGPQRLAGDLEPGAGVAAQVQDGSTRPQDVVLRVNLLQLEG
jgi:hypothetical protein